MRAGHAPADVLVLGAGMVGVGTALALQQRGHHVTLVDRHASCRETSYGNAGIIQREAVEPYGFPRDLRQLLGIATGRRNEAHYHVAQLLRLVPALLRYWRNSAPAPYARIAAAYAQLIRHCIAEHQGWIDAAQAQDLVGGRGWREAYRSPRLLAQAAAHAQPLAARAGLGLQLLDGPALAAAEPGLRGPMAGALHWTDPWTIRHPGQLVDRYVALLRRRGGRLVQGNADTLRASGAGWAVDTEDGRIDAPTAVLALGPWSDRATRALGYRLPLFVKRGYHRHYRGGTTLAMPLLDTEQGVLLAPMQQGLRITTGAEFAALDAPPTPRQLARGEQAARTLLDLGDPVEAQPWMGARPCTVDMLPVIGPAPRHRGLWFNFGHSHQGFTLGPASGRLLAELIGGETPYIDPVPYAPQRFGA